MIDRILGMLEGLQFEELNWSTIQGLWPEIMEIIKNPASNIPAAILIMAIVTILLLIIGSSVFAFILNTDDEEYETEVVQTVQSGVEGGAPVQRVVRVRYVKDPLRYHKRVLIAVGVGLVLVVGTGYTTQTNLACTSCHVGVPHVERSEADPHRDVACVRCHDGTTLVGSMTVSVVPRVAHIVSGALGEGAHIKYAQVTGRGCRHCHSDVLDGVVEIPDRALRISHREPSEAGAGCLDCHILDGDERIAQVTAGMTPCLRCHNNDVASADCAVCHAGDVSKAVVATHTRSTNNARELVSNPDCYTCHDPEPCDACHGVRLPHPAEYAAQGHMRDAAIELWSNDGKRCFACHTETRRSCYASNCHEFDMPFHSQDGSFRRLHQSEPVGTCDSCHNRYGLYENACLMCHKSTPK